MKESKITIANKTVKVDLPSKESVELGSTTPPAPKALLWHADQQKLSLGTSADVDKAYVDAADANLQSQIDNIPPVDETNLVHKTGDETLGGKKTFGDTVTVLGAGDYSTALVKITSTNPYGEAKIAIRGYENNNDAQRFEIGQNANGNAYMTLGAFANLDIGTNGQTRMRITQNGNVGIGTTAPEWALDIASGSAGNGASLQTQSDILVKTGSIFFGGYSYGGNFIGGHPAFGSMFGLYGGNTMVTMNNGKVGIAKGYATEALDVDGKVNATEYRLNGAQALKQDADGILTLGNGNNNQQYYYSNYFQWLTPGTYKGMSLDNSGNLKTDGTMTATAFIGDGSQLTNLPSTTVDGGLVKQAYSYGNLPHPAPNQADVYMVLTGAEANRLYRWNGAYYDEISPSASDVNKAYVDAADSNLQGQVTSNSNNITSINTTLGNKANLASPALTGTPTAPTAPSYINNTQVATTAFVYNAVSNKVDKSFTNQTFLGYNAGGVNNVSSGGDGLTFIGSTAGGKNYTNNQTFVGVGAGRETTSGPNNTFIGCYAGQNNTTGQNNAVFGHFAGRLMTTGSQNVFMGAYAGQSTSGSFNTLLGHSAGQNISGSNNIAIGANSGPATAALSNSISIGAGAQATTDNTMFITDTVKVGIGIQAPTSKLTVNGDIEVAAGFNYIGRTPNGTRVKLTFNDDLTMTLTAI